AAGGLRFPRRVRCERHVFEPRQRVIWANRLALKHIKRGMCEAARPQSSNERRLINEGTARRVDQDGTSPHQCKTPSIDETARLWDEPNVQAHRIGGGKKRIEWGGLCRHVRGYARPVPGKDAHAHRGCDASHLRADATHAHHPKRASSELEAFARRPAPCPNGPVHAG